MKNILIGLIIVFSLVLSACSTTASVPSFSPSGFYSGNSRIVESGTIINTTANFLPRASGKSQEVTFRFGNSNAGFTVDLECGRLESDPSAHNCYGAKGLEVYVFKLKMQSPNFFNGTAEIKNLRDGFTANLTFGLSKQ